MPSPVPVRQVNPAARNFLRSLNILLKYSRLYGPTHLRSTEQFENTWSEMDAALRASGGEGLLLGLGGAELLLDGVPLGVGTAEKSLAQLLSAAGIASIHFTSKMTAEDLKRFQLAVIESGKKPAELAANLKNAFAKSPGVRVNQLRFVAQREGEKSAPAHVAQLAAAALTSSDASQIHDWLSDPHKLLQAIAAVEGKRNTGSINSAIAMTGETSVAGLEEQELAMAFRMLTQWSQNADAPPGDDSINLLKIDSQRALRNALISLSEKPEPDRPMLLQLAEHLAIRFALERYERGDVRVNAVREMLDRMSKQMDALRTVLAGHEERMSKAGVAPESHGDILDRHFWAAVPEKGKRSVLLSPDACCIPAANVASYVEELMARGEDATAEKILANYAAGIRSQDAEERKRAAIGLSHLAPLYRRFAAQLQAAINLTCVQLGDERDPEMQKLVSATFVQLSQQAADSGCYAAVQQSLAALDGLDARLPELAAQLRPRIGVEDRLPEFVQQAVSSPAAPADLLEVLRALPQATTERAMQQFQDCVRRDELERLVALVEKLGPAAAQHLRDHLQSETAEEAVASVGLLSRIDPALTERDLPKRLRSWGRAQQDAAIRQLAAAASPARGKLLLKLVDYADAVLLPQVLDEIGLSGDRQSSSRLMSLAFDFAAGENGDYLRVKAIEALGRLRELKAEPHLRQMVEARELLHWKLPRELRVSAAQALLMLDPGATRPFLAHKNISPQELALGPLPPMSECRWTRQRRYSRIAQHGEVAAILTAREQPAKLRVEQLGLGGGLAVMEGSPRDISSSGAVDLNLRAGLQQVRARVWLRAEKVARSQEQKFSFEILGINLDDRSRLRRMLTGERLNIPAALFDRKITGALPMALR